MSDPARKSYYREARRLSEIDKRGVVTNEIISGTLIGYLTKGPPYEHRQVT